MSYIRTEAHKKKMSKIKKRQWQNSASYRKKQIKHLRNIWKNPKHRKFMTERFSGEKNPKWTGGIKRTGGGYILIHTPQHPNAYQNYIPQAELIVEQYIKRYLTPKETVHHINKVVYDDRPENLIAFKSKSAHRRFHYNPNNVKLKEIIFDGRKLVQPHNKEVP